MKTYLDKIDNFNDSNVEDALAEYIFYHYNKKSSLSKFSPNDLRGVSDPTLIDIIIKKIIKSFKKHIINKNEIIDEGEKLLLWNKIIINNEFILKILMKKKVLFVYLVLFKNLLMKIL